MPSSCRRLRRLFRRSPVGRAAALGAAAYVACLGVAVTSANAAPLTAAEFGVNMSSGQPASLTLASSAGVGEVRQGFTAGEDSDSAVAALAGMHLRAYAILGLPAAGTAATDTAQMAAYTAGFALRYGPGGSFWAQNPQLPYLPVTHFEIGNEPNATPDPTLAPNWSQTLGPSGYALLYETARTALHAVDPTGVAVVAGMLDASGGLASVESYLSQIGPMDAVGFHPYLYAVSSMESDTQSLRTWLSAHGHAGVPIDINEFDSQNGFSTSISAWGQQMAAFTQWALCTSSLGVDDLQPFWWGSTSQVGQPGFGWYSMTDANGAPTALGSAYLAEVTTLTSQGCPATRTPVTSAPVTNAGAAKPSGPTKPPKRTGLSPAGAGAASHRRPLIRRTLIRRVRSPR